MKKPYQSPRLVTRIKALKRSNEFYSLLVSYALREELDRLSLEPTKAMLGWERPDDLELFEAVGDYSKGEKSFFMASACCDQREDDQGPLFIVEDGHYICSRCALRLAIQRARERNKNFPHRFKTANDQSVRRKRAYSSKATQNDAWAFISGRVRA